MFNIFVFFISLIIIYFRINGERWERESCARCRMNGNEIEGLACDDNDPQRLCLQEKCSKSVCHNKQQGSFCDKK